MSKGIHPLSRYTAQAIALLGAEVRKGRIERRWTVKDLAERVGISPNTLLRVEKGNPDVGVGIVLECAALVGVTLFYEDPDETRAALRHNQQMLTLMPSRVRRSSTDREDDF